jgi:hypothetical protein
MLQEIGPSRASIASSIHDKFDDRLKTLSQKDEPSRMEDLAYSLSKTFEALNKHRIIAGVDTYGKGMSPWMVHPSYIIIYLSSASLADRHKPGEQLSGSSSSSSSSTSTSTSTGTSTSSNGIATSSAAAAAAAAAEFMLPGQAGVLGELINEPFRWDQKVLIVVVDVSGTSSRIPQNLKRGSTATNSGKGKNNNNSDEIISSVPQNLKHLCFVTGGSISVLHDYKECVEFAMQMSSRILLNNNYSNSKMDTPLPPTPSVTIRMLSSSQHAAPNTNIGKASGNQEFVCELFPKYANHEFHWPFPESFEAPPVSIVAPRPGDGPPLKPPRQASPLLHLRHTSTRHLSKEAIESTVSLDKCLQIAKQLKFPLDRYIMCLVDDYRVDPLQRKALTQLLGLAAAGDKVGVSFSSTGEDNCYGIIQNIELHRAELFLLPHSFQKLMPLLLEGEMNAFFNYRFFVCHESPLPPTTPHYYHHLLSEGEIRD